MLTVLIGTVLLQAVALALIMALAWLVQHLTGNSGWIDVCWTLAVGSVGAASALAGITGQAPLPTRQLVVAGLVIFWSLRLASHIARRTLRHGDDPRYADLIRKWGSSAPLRLFGFAQTQALAGVPLVLAVALAAQRPEQVFGLQDWLGAITWAIGISTAAFADRQIRLFASDSSNRGKLCDQGLWAWSRHPNYFFEWLGWVGVALIAVDFSGNHLCGWIAVTAPVWMYWLLVQVSGIPPLEEHMLRSRGDRFSDYQKRTPAFFPWPPAAPPSR